MRVCRKRKKEKKKSIFNEYISKMCADHFTSIVYNFIIGIVMFKTLGEKLNFELPTSK